MSDILPAQQPTTSNPALTEESVPQPASAPEPEPNLATSPEIEPKNNGKWLWIATTLIVVASLIVAGYFYYQNLQLRQQAGLTEPIETPQTPPVTGDPTEEWEVYANEVFSLTYPPEFNLEEQPGGITRLMKIAPGHQTATELYDGISLTFRTEEALGLDPLTFAQNRIQESDETVGGDLIEEARSTNLNGYNAATYTYRGLGVFRNIIAQSSDRTMFVVISDGTVDPNNLGYEEIVDQILSTFEFNSKTDKATSIPSDWKSQTLTTDGVSTYFRSFTIYHPPDWIVNKSEYLHAGFDFTLSKNDTKMSIRQGEFGWGTCSFPDNYIGEEGMISQMTQMYPDIQFDNDIIWRIAKPSGDGNSKHFSVCQLNPHSSDGYNERFMGATQTGMISIEKADNAALEEIAQILSTIEFMD